MPKLLKVDSTLKAAAKRLSQMFEVWSQSFALLRRACPRLSIFVGIGAILEAAANLGVLYAIKELVDSLSRHIGAEHDSAGHEPLMAVAVTGVVILASVLITKVNGFLRMKQGLLVTEYVDRKLHERAARVDLEFFDSPLYHDTLERARSGGSERPAQVVSSLVSTLRASIEIAFVLTLLSNIEWRLFPLLLLPLLAALVARLLYTRRQFEWRMIRSQLERRAGYLDWLLTSPVTAKELRLHGTGDYFQQQYRSVRTQLNDEQTKLERARVWTEALVAIVGAVVFVAAAGWLIQQTIQNQRPVGDVVFFVLLLRRTESGGSELIGNISKVVDDQLYLSRLFEFLSLKPRISMPASPRTMPAGIVDGVRLENVSFQYEGAPRPALQNISMHIPPDKVVALVGENGSGKTTLIKLLTRLYDPTSGVVTLDGADIRSYDPEEYRKLFSVIFQDFAFYAASAGENIRLGDIATESGADRIREAAERAGAASFIELLPNAYDTRLTKLFDGGQELSIGQWQRLALARAFYPRSRFIVLDEPTSAVDPKAEDDLFQDFRRKIGGRGALLISHRLSTVRLADYTYVLENGIIIEHGTHEELVRAGGSYAVLFDKQARHYR
jgi:ATP-binding cassette, subfamily B, bacterial